MASRMSKILLRTLVGGSLAILMGVIMNLAYDSEDGFVVWVFGALVTVGCVFEVARMEQVVSRRLRRGLWLGLLVALAPGLVHYFARAHVDTSALYATYLSGRGILVTYVVAALALLIAALPRLGVLPLVFSVWLLAPMTSLTLIWSDYGTDGLIALLILSKLGDIFGYYVGNAIGKSHPFPKVSPGKTTAGCVASLVAGTLAGGLCVHYGLLPNGTWGLVGGLLAGGALNIAAQAGDLLESRLKRLAKVKDSGVWFGPSGGVLDLADSLLLSVPAALLIFPLLFA